jgi:heavy metal translocating P-type ATPase
MNSAAAPVSESRFPRLDMAIAIFASAAIACHLVLEYGTDAAPLIAAAPLFAALALGGAPLIWNLARRLMAREFGSDLLAGLAIISAVLMREYLVASIVVLMLSGGAALEQYAARSASSVLAALARRTPQIAHRRVGETSEDIPLSSVGVGDLLVVLPHEICPVDGVVVDGMGSMDESYLTGEPFRISKAPGAQVLSGAINGDAVIVIRAEKLAIDSRYARIMRVMQESEQGRPHLRRMADRLGAWYTPFAVLIAGAAAFISGDLSRFVAVLVIATPCPLLIGIPVAVIGAISLAARRGIIVKNPVILEQVDRCHTLIFDKTGTLTYGRPALSDITPAPGFSQSEALRYAASLEQYSKHPLSMPIVEASRNSGVPIVPASEISERPGEGLSGTVEGRTVQITGRAKALATGKVRSEELPAIRPGLECLLLVDGAYFASFTFVDEPRTEGRAFVEHLGPNHDVDRVILLSGDREAEVRHLATAVGISEVHAGKSPEEKLAIVRKEAAKGRTLFVGDGINDAPAMLAATVGVAFGHGSDIIAEAAGAVILDPSLLKVDELMHIGRRMRTIALESAVGGMALSLAGMLAAALGYLPPIAGAITQEAIDVLAVVNAIRVAIPPSTSTDVS